MKITFSALFIALSLVTSLFAVEVRVATYNVLTGIGSNANSGRAPLQNTLSRINADILTLQEVISDDLNAGHLADLADALGYDHVFIPATALDTGSRVIILSKFPFVAGSETSLVSPPGANDVTRAAAAVKVDVPGTINDPVVITAHLKCCFDLDDPFRRAVEMLRIRRYVEGLELDVDDPVFVTGDLNLLGGDFTFQSIPDGLPPSYSLGSDITFPVQYFADPTRYFDGLGIVNPGYVQQDGMTVETFDGSSTVLDHLLTSSAVASRVPATEIYNSAWEGSFAGLPKSGVPLATGTSALASDHFPVFGDFELDSNLTFELSASTTTLEENAPALPLTVTLSTSLSAPLTVSFQSSDPGELEINPQTVTIPAGATTASVALSALLDQVNDGTQEVTIQASAPGFRTEQLTFSVVDADPAAYLLTSTSTPVSESFEGFTGEEAPAAWTAPGVNWIGLDDGSRSLLGARSYQGSLGALSSETITFQTNVTNLSGATLQSLRLDYLAQHWRRFTEGSPDQIQVSVTHHGATRLIPELTFNPTLTGTAGALSPPQGEAKSAYLRRLNLADGETLNVTFTIVPGVSGGEISEDVFLNEFHYDNTNTDEGEFVEVFVGPGFSGDLASIRVHFYNGNNGLSYGSVESLDTFTEGPSSGPGSARLFFKNITGIQNGAPDGIALEVGGTLKEFWSYEGTFTASGGIADGVLSSSVGVSQSAGTSVGMNSIARSGTGGAASDFTWGIQPGSHTPGVLNVGQSLGATPQPQGLAIDDFSLTPLSDSDGDGLPDEEELVLGTDPGLSDSDGDGQSDFFESLLSLTNPLSSTSKYETSLTSTLDGANLTFPTLDGRTYGIEFSTDLDTWATFAEEAGNGEPVSVTFPTSGTMFFRIRISLP